MKRYGHKKSRGYCGPHDSEKCGCDQDNAGSERASVRDRLIEELKAANTNSTVDNRERRKQLSCSYCRPNRGENCKKHAKHGVTKPKYKDKR
jgi:hypothetical protein